MTLCVRTCACVDDRPAARPWPPPAVPPAVRPTPGANPRTWHASTSRSSNAAFGPVRNQPNASLRGHPYTRTCRLTDHPTCDGACETTVVGPRKPRRLDGDHQGAGPFDQAATTRPSSVGGPSDCPADARAASSAVIRHSPGYRSSLGISRRGEPRRREPPPHATDANPFTVVRVRRGTTRSAHGRVLDFVHVVKDRTSRRVGYRGGNHNDPDTAAAVTHGLDPSSGMSRRGSVREVSSVSAPLCRLTAGRGEPAAARVG